jgi:hypothetical protein
MFKSIPFTRTCLHLTFVMVIGLAFLQYYQHSGGILLIPATTTTAWCTNGPHSGEISSMLRLVWYIFFYSDSFSLVLWLQISYLQSFCRHLIASSTLVTPTAHNRWKKTKVYIISHWGAIFFTFLKTQWHMLCTKANCFFCLQLFLPWYKVFEFSDTLLAEQQPSSL